MEKQKAVYVRKVEVLFKVTKMVKETKDMDVVLDKLLTLVRELLDSDQAQIFLQDEFTGTQVCEVSSSKFDDAADTDAMKTVRPGVAHPAEYAIASHVIETGQGALIADCTHFVNYDLGLGAVVDASTHSASGEAKQHDASAGPPAAPSCAAAAAVPAPGPSSTSLFCAGLHSVAGIVVPIATHSGRIIGVIFASNFSHKQFHAEDLELLDAFRSELRGAVARISLEATVGAGLKDRSTEGGAQGMTAPTAAVSASSKDAASLLALFTTSEGRDKQEQRSEHKAGRKQRLKRQSSMIGRVQAEALSGSPDEDLVNWAFDPFNCGGRQVLYANFAKMFVITGMQERFDLELHVLTRFAHDIASRYRDNPYHNFEHGFSTAHFCFISVVKVTALTKMLRSLDVFAMLVAALMHDVDHRGTNNMFLMQMNDPLATIYNDISVLENHHAAVGWEVIRAPDPKDPQGSPSPANVTRGLSREDFATFRKTTIKAILHTDMAHHFEIIEKLASLDPLEPFQVNEPTDRMSLVGTLLHAADISNPLIPDFDLVERWVRCVCLFVFYVCVCCFWWVVFCLTFLGSQPCTPPSPALRTQQNHRRGASRRSLSTSMRPRWRTT